MKIAGAIPGAIDAVQDLTNKNSKGNWDPKLAGDHNFEKVSNALVVGSTVLDFVPGLEAVGALGNLASAALGMYGETKDQSSLKTKDKAVVSSVKPMLNSALNVHMALMHVTRRPAGDLKASRPYKSLVRILACEGNPPRRYYTNFVF